MVQLSKPGNTWSMMAIGDKTGTPDRKAACLDALQWALEVMRDDPLRHVIQDQRGLALGVNERLVGDELHPQKQRQIFSIREH